MQTHLAVLYVFPIRDAQKNNNDGNTYDFCVILVYFESFKSINTAQKYRTWWWVLGELQ